MDTTTLTTKAIKDSHIIELTTEIIVCILAWIIILFAILIYFFIYFWRLKIAYNSKTMKIDQLNILPNSVPKI